MDSRASALPHLDLLHDVVERFAAVLDGADEAALARPVPALTRWTVGDVAAHLAGVHRWCAGVVRDGRRPVRGSVPAGPEGLAETYRRSAAEMLDVLRAADPDRVCWTMDRTDRRAGFWPRRQLHEVLVHLWDVRSVSDPTPAAVADVAAEVAADGVDELLQMAPTRLGSRRDPLPGTLELLATDTGSRWLLGTGWLLGEEPRGADGTGPTVADDHLGPAAVVRGTAHGLLLHVWGRGPFAQATGDPATLRAFDRATIRG